MKLTLRRLLVPLCCVVTHGPNFYTIFFTGSLIISLRVLSTKPRDINDFVEDDKKNATFTIASLFWVSGRLNFCKTQPHNGNFFRVNYACICVRKLHKPRFIVQVGRLLMHLQASSMV